MSPLSLYLDLSACAICFVVPFFAQSFTEDIFLLSFLWQFLVSSHVTAIREVIEARKPLLSCFYSIPQQATKKKKRSLTSGQLNKPF